MILRLTSHVDDRTETGTRRSQLPPNRVSDFDIAEREWNDLYKVSGVAALLAVFIFRRWLAEESWESWQMRSAWAIPLH
jgi:hypothetical protein